ncbi:hypothetical protein TNCV_3633821 [Trichonephila clavipes]|nr:hypothetical protein TNCV_3633821 [Trichonephila clavipes]
MMNQKKFRNERCFVRSVAYCFQSQFSLMRMFPSFVKSSNAFQKRSPDPEETTSNHSASNHSKVTKCHLIAEVVRFNNKWQYSLRRINGSTAFEE